MLHRISFKKFISTLLLSILCFDQFVLCKRGGGGFGRGSSGARTSSSRGGISSKSSGGGGWFSSGSKSHSSSYPSGGGGGFSRGGSGAGYGSGSFAGSKKSKGTGFGSAMRSNTFKNMIVGAAAGYLTYQAGKAIIRNIAAPMTWGNRNYYWGSQYYRGSPGANMCRMPVDSNDPQFGNVYTSDYSRPKEIVWSCPLSEDCCGYECCPRYYGGGGFGYSSGASIFGILLIVLLCVCCGFIIYKLNRERNSQNKYVSARSKADIENGANNQEECVPPPKYPSSPPPKYGYPD